MRNLVVLTVLFVSSSFAQPRWYRAGQFYPPRWSQRFLHSMVERSDTLWLMGGQTLTIGEYRDDVWFSADGCRWTRATDSAGWRSRSNFTSLVYNNRLWVLGGTYALGGRLSDVWYSSDGIHWDTATTRAPWSAREGHSSVVFNNKMWVIGGSHCDDVWSSTDGASWTLVTDSAGWSPRLGHTSLAYQNKLWVLGGEDGGYLNDVWSSEDGVRWSLVTDSAAWSPRSYHSSAVFDDRMWVISGAARNNGFQWSSIDGSNWVGVSQTTGGSYGYGIAVMDGRLWLSGGTDALRVSDSVWFMRLPRPLAQSQWPMFRHDAQHSGLSQYRGARSAYLKWSFQSGYSISSSPVIGPDSTLFISSEDDTLYVLNSLGQVVRKWPYYGGAISTPCVADDGVLYTNTARLSALHPDLPSPLWTLASGASEQSPVVDSSGVIYARSPAQMFGAVGADGYLDWYILIYASMSSPALHPDGYVCFGDIQGRLHARNPDSTRRWELLLPERIRSSPMIGVDGTIYVGCDNGKLYAVDAAGTIKWSYQTGADIVSSPARNAAGRIFVGSDDSCVYALEDSVSYVKLRWKYRTGGAVQSSPAVSADGLVYVGSDDGLVYCFRGTDSTVLWTRTTGGPVRSSPAIGDDGTVYVGSDDGRLYAIGEGVGTMDDRGHTIDRGGHNGVYRGVLFSPLRRTSALLDISGRHVMDLKPGPNDVSRLAPGVYFVRQASGVERQTASVTKVVIAR